MAKKTNRKTRQSKRPAKAAAKRPRVRLVEGIDVWYDPEKGEPHGTVGIHPKARCGCGGRMQIRIVAGENVQPVRGIDGIIKHGRDAKYVRRRRASSMLWCPNCRASIWVGKGSAQGSTEPKPLWKLRADARVMPAVMEWLRGDGTPVDWRGNELPAERQADKEPTKPRRGRRGRGAATAC